jgi:RHS repeat-associated protein
MYWGLGTLGGWMVIRCRHSQSPISFSFSNIFIWNSRHWRSFRFFLSSLDAFYRFCSAGARLDYPPLIANRVLARVIGHVDHLNTPRLIADSTGTAVWRWDNTEPFGDTVADENPSGLGAFPFPLRFPGTYDDPETNGLYNYFRDLDRALGRYRQSDLIGLRGGLNTYAYVNGNPLGYVDPNGLMRCRWVGIVLRCEWGSPPGSTGDSELVFAEVAPRPMPLRNSRGSPMYALCFAAGNPKGAPIAVKIANHLLTA